MLKRYFLFLWHRNYTGGFNDYENSFDTITEIKKYVQAYLDNQPPGYSSIIFGYDEVECQIVDTKIMEIIRTGSAKTGGHNGKFRACKWKVW